MDQARDISTKYLQPLIPGHLEPHLACMMRVLDRHLEPFKPVLENVIDGSATAGNRGVDVAQAASKDDGWGVGLEATSDGNGLFRLHVRQVQVQ